MTDANIRTIIGCVPRVPSCSDPNLILGTKQADAILSAIAAAGFKVLARDPTQKMILDIKPHAPKIVERHDVKTPEGRTRLEVHIQFGDVWRVMWDAAP